MKRQLLAAALGLAVTGGAVLSGPAQAQSSPSAYVSGYRYDAIGRLTGAISPDADGVSPFEYGAVRNTYNAAGALVKVETGVLSSWQSNNVLPSNWGSAFVPLTIVETTFDAMGRKTHDLTKGSNGAPVSLTQYSYDTFGRLECTAVRMNPGELLSPPASACEHDTYDPAHGYDRITRNVYDTAGHVLQVREAVGTPLESAEVTYTYTPTGKVKQVIDAEGNRAELCYDGHDRQIRWVFPSATGPASFTNWPVTTAVATAGTVNGACTGTSSTWDYEEYAYDGNGNRTSLRRRDGSTLGYEYDALNRMTRKTVPNRADLPDTHEFDVVYAYDLRGLQTSATFKDASESSVGSVTKQYDGLGRIDYTDAWMAGDAIRRLDYAYDANGNRTQVKHPGDVDFNYLYDGLNRLKELREESVWLMTLKYNTRGMLSELQRDRATSYWTRDVAGRLDGMSHYATNPVANVGWTFQRNAASQVTSVARSDSSDRYAWKGYYNVVRPYEANGLNQYTTAGTTAFCHDRNGNLTADGTYVYRYDVENRLVEKRAQGTGNANCLALSYAGALQAQLRYDPMGRLYEVYAPTTGTIRRLLYDGDALVAEYGANSNDPPLRRFVHGSDAKVDDPLLWYEGSGLGESSRRHLLADHQGSIVGVLDGLGNPLDGKYNSYDEYGIPSSSNQGRFQYTGQAWVPEIGMYYYKARFYSPTLGRFLQVDPVGYDDQFNLYAYVGNDPQNQTDSTGTQSDTVMDRRNQAFLEVMRECEGLGPECAAMMAEGIGIGLIAADILTIPSGEGPILARALGRGAIALLGRNAGRVTLRSLNLQAVTISARQLGAKFAAHYRQLGLRSGDVAGFRRWIDRVTRNADMVVPGRMSGGGEGGTREVLFWVRGDDVVATTRTGDFVTVMPGGRATNNNVKTAIEEACKGGRCQ